MQAAPFYTIGYQGASVSGFIAALKAAGVGLVLDVRHSPYSLRKEFCQDELNQALAAEGIAYEHVPALGNPPEGRAAVRAGHLQSYREIFSVHLAGAAAQKALDRVARLARRKNVCLMCLERAPTRCHRFMVAEELAQRAGLEAHHLTVKEGRADPRQQQLDFL